MNLRWQTKLSLTLVLLAVCAAWIAGPGCAVPPSDPRPPRPPEGLRAVKVTRTNYHGWPDAIVMRGAGLEVFIVPAIGRIMQFQFVGEPGPFWENRALDGQLYPSRATNWLNFGGDKSWPAPEAEWPKPFGSWLPPAAFDSMPAEAKIEGNQVTLVSSVDPDYGIRVVRHIYLGPKRGMMTVSTRYEKVLGPPKNVGVWTITQLGEPEGVFSPVPQPSRFTGGFHPLSKVSPPDLKLLTTFDANPRLLGLTRNPKAAHKIGLESGSLLWVGGKTMLRIDLPRVRDAKYPDGGSSAEIYTNPDPLLYVELEMLSPLHLMNPGDVIEWANRYTLLRRSLPTPEAEARAIYGR